ncbi:complex I subunit 5 family protein [Natronincola ferrireducens]|uniref:Formate hydrogenlyase subunit 3/Multisubunit Na+/H+ antiporter, MnhD subunit n=1 Tax=Natronincola ferrireducens TaxID=393762 RepID=A0A1G9G6A3_9FIRM|nr:complex I subunit 5 family protein [Natronincola ferrireducens]SDK95823.1 Formate hydrogenlyase subunit 3/Multisubunit Na+/H+ antiporter, MnhD subunit [Natronincola ferrireducens]
MDVGASVVRLGLPSLVISFAILEVLILPFIGNKTQQIRRNTVKAFIFLTTVFVALTYREVLNEPIIYEISGVFEMGIIFKIDLLNYLFIILAGVLWLVIGYYSLEDTNYFFYTITYIATIGTLMAGDLLSFFLFFEMMTFSSYALMVYHRGEEQLEAGNVYIYMGIIGGLCILSGILMLSAYTGSFEWTHLAMQFSEMGFIKYFIAAFLIIGFGIKSAMFPFHFWVPRIYGGAPISVNALSSGMLMKVGAYGMLKVVSVIFSADVSETTLWTDAVWKVSNHIGVVIIWLGILTMIVGVFMALQQGNMKKMLAYHSVSQMGYIIMGIGVAAYLGFQGPMGFIGSIYHMLNHSLFKVLLFMVAGIVYIRTRELNMYELGGLWKKMPITAVLCLIAVFGITGMPGFNGFASKSILHHAIIEAYEYGHPSFKYAELFFKLVSAGTVCSFIKFFSYIFLGEEKEKYQNIKGDSGRIAGAMAVLAIFIIIIGVRPYMLMDRLFIPMTASFAYDPVFMEKYIVDMNFWNAKDIIGMVGVYTLGFGMFIISSKYHLFHLNLPRWANTEAYVYTPVTDICEKFPNYCVNKYENKIIFGDVLIYAILLTIILAFLLLSGF